MTTLAQMIIEDEIGFRDEAADLILRLTQNRFGHGKGFHVTNGDELVDSGVLTKLAEKFVFAGEGPAMVEKHIGFGLTHDAVRANARLPVDVMWVEWTEDLGGVKFQLGFLLDRHYTLLEDPGVHNVTAFFFGAVDGLNAVPLFALQFTQGLPPPRPALRPGMGTTLVWCKSGLLDEEAHDHGLTAAHRILQALFLINTPRTTEYVEVTHSGKLQKARKKRGKLPLLEYRKVTLKIGSPHRIHVPDGPRGSSEEETHHRRLHQVMGHFKTYTKRQDTPKVAWVDSFWRGDASLGVVMHERKVTK